MSIWKPFRKMYIKTTNLTHSYQGKDKKLVSFYKAWSYCYDLSVGLDPAFGQEMKNMIVSTVRPKGNTLDIGCGTGISTFHASQIADRVTGIDLSADMIAKLEKKIRRKKIKNVDVITGRFPEALPEKSSFDSIISSYAIVHFTPEERKNVYKEIYKHLVSGGCLGLFSAQGEVATSFETKDEITKNLELANFQNIEIKDVSDIYRIVTAHKN